MCMSIFGLDKKQKLARARADLRMGAPVVVVGTSASLIYSAEVIDQSRFNSFRDHFNDTRLIITARRDFWNVGQSYLFRRSDGPITLRRFAESFQ